MTALKLWQEYPARVIRSYQGAEVRVEASPELIGVGYISAPHRRPICLLALSSPTSG